MSSGGAEEGRCWQDGVGQGDILRRAQQEPRRVRQRERMDDFRKIHN